MTVVLGEGEHRYAAERGWGRLPDGWSLNEVGGVGVDSRNRVYVFNRGDHPMVVFDSEGNFLTSWGEGLFKRPHAVHMGPDDTIFCTDDGDHTVRKCTLDGKELLTLGTPGEPSPYMSLRPFCRCTHTACAPNGDIYVSDGYGNACIHKYDPAGRYLKSWGSPGTRPGEFNIPHNITCDADGWVYVADRESHRIQVFDGEGRYETQWNNLHRPSAIYMPRGSCPLCYVGEAGPSMSVNRTVPNLGARVTILDNTGEPVARLGGEHPGNEPGQFISPHGIAVDSTGSIYVGEVSRTAWGHYNPGVPMPEPLHCLSKLTKLDQEPLT
jgi:DNA-binding beta-propeller fold protein YncE